VRTLAARIASEAHPQGTIALDVRNLSTISSQDAMSIRLTLESELKQREFRILPRGSTDNQVQVSLSESAETYVWVAKVIRAQGDEREPQVVMVTVERAVNGRGEEKTDSLSLNRKLVWEQRAKILDFARAGSSPESFSRLLVLEPEKLVFYRADGTRWEMERALPIPHTKPFPRDIGGWIDTRMNRVYVRGMVCGGDFLQPESVRCEPADPWNDVRPQLRLKIPDREGVDTVTLGSICGENLAALATGKGDWTQPDSIQGYVSFDGHITASGAALEMDGPVMSLYPADTLHSARAVVRNLKTGNYEAYLVTATCSH
jgi:hypothetical protein